MEIFICICIVAAVIYSILIVILFDYNYYLKATKKYSEGYKNISFKDFKKSFAKVDWEYNINYPKSLFKDKIDFGKKTKITSFFTSYFHASTIIIDEVGMILNIFDYFRAINLKNRYIKYIKNESKH